MFRLALTIPVFSPHPDTSLTELQHRDGSAEHEQDHGTVFQDSEERGGRQFSVDAQESGAEVFA